MSGREPPRLDDSDDWFAEFDDDRAPMSDGTPVPAWSEGLMAGRTIKLRTLIQKVERAESGQRVAVARTLALRPALILLDEPFASLDAIVRARIVQEFVQLVEREQISVLLVTHDLEEALGLSDVVYLLSRGPRARVTERYAVAIPRPRNVVQARTHPAFAPLYEKLWDDLSREVDQVPPAGAP